MVCFFSGGLVLPLCWAKVLLTGLLMCSLSCDAVHRLLQYIAEFKDGHKVLSLTASHSHEEVT